jgi:ketosteroid isomerase-like protein
MTTDNLPTLLFESFQAHDLDRWYQALADDFEASYPNARQGLSKEEALAYNQPFDKAFSDMQFEFSNSATSGDLTYTRWDADATHDGPLALGPDQVVPPTGKKISLPGVIMVKVRGDKIVREETYWNLVEMLTQLGLMP